MFIPYHYIYTNSFCAYGTYFSGARDTWRKKDWNFDAPFVAHTNISTKPTGFAASIETAVEGSSKPKFVKFSSAVFMAQSEEEGGGFMFSTGDN
ncbi:hypothetical protein EON65_37520 [archaeon]|nr:MAG: hypothetical protein EON65_37520 [archaeon]